MNINQFSKEAIKSRMFRLATIFWNMQNVDSLDPLVKLLIESVAEEIYRVSDNVSTMEARLLEKLANILTPDLLISPSPAHAILHARPVEKSSIIDMDCSMRYENSAFIKRNNLKDLTFSPVCQTKVYNGDVEYVIANGLLYQYDSNRTKHLIARSKETYANANQVWLALELDPQIKSLDKLSFYIDFPNTPNKNEYLYLLPYSKWQLMDNRIEMHPGIYLLDKEQTVSEEQAFFKYEVSNRIDEKILKIYKNHFMTVSADIKIEFKKQTTQPDFLSELYSEEIVSELNRPFIWLCIEFPPSFTKHALDDMTININCFPVANKFKYEKNNKVDDVLGIIPLRTEDNEYFLSVESMRNANNKQYHEVPFQTGEEDSVGTYTVRRGGCERFDARNAKDFLMKLSDLLTDETAAFAYKSRAKLGDLAYKMEKLVTQMNQYSSGIDEKKEIPYYLLIDDLEKNEFFEIKYWVTNCELANNLRVGLVLRPYSTTIFDNKSVVLLSTSYGGKREPKAEEKLNMYKYVLTTRDRIVTIDDIKSFCNMQLGEIISNVEVKKGVAISEKPKEGLLRTIDVSIRLKARLNKQEDYEKIKADIKTKLIEKSPDTYNYRVFINNK